MKWSMLRDLSVHNTSLPFDHTCCLDKSELETCLRFPVSTNRSRKQQSELFFLFPFLQQFKSMLPTDTSTFDTFLFVSARGILRIRSDSGNFCFQGFFIFIVSHFDICTRFSNWFDAIANWCYISIQSFRWTYDRTTLPYLLPDC